MPRGTKLNIIDILIYLSLLVVGVLLRLYRISTESISLEEYACIANLDVDSILNFIALQRHTYPFGGIFFPLLQFLWVRLVNNDIVSLRLFSLLFWVATYVLIVWFINNEEKKSILPSGVSYLVAIGLCFSPAFIFLGQEARMYMAYVFFAWCSIISFYYLLLQPTSSICGLLWTVSNGCLLWTHHIGVILWCVEGLIVGMLFIQKPIFRNSLLQLGIFHLVIAAFWFVWILTVPPQPPQLYQYYIPPTLKNLIEFPFAFNVVKYGGICPADAYLSFNYLPRSIGEMLRTSHKQFNLILMIVSSLSILGFIYWAIRKEPKQKKLSLYLLLFFVLPPLLLFLIARLGPPAFTSRYLVFIVPLHFCGLGILISPARKIIKRAFTLMVCLLLFYQIGYMVSANWRMDWKGVGNTISAKGSHNDLIIIRDPFWTKIFEINSPDISIPVSDAYTYDGIIDIAKVYLTLWWDRGIPVSVWAVVPDVYGEGSPTLMLHVDKSVFSVSVQMFPGEQKIWLYRLTLNTLPPYQPYTTLLPLFTKPLPLLLKQATQRIPQYYKAHRYDPDRTQFHLVRAGLVLAMENKFDLAGNLIIEAWNKNPNRIIQDWELFPELVYTNAFCPEVSTHFAYFREGLKCFLEKDFLPAIENFLQFYLEYPYAPLPLWFIAKAYDSLDDTSHADFFWRNVFISAPILPLGWHPSYESAVVTLDDIALSLAKRREEKLDIINDDL